MLRIKGALIFFIISLFGRGLINAQQLDGKYINYYPKAPIIVENKIEFGVYNYDPNNVDHTQLIIKILDKNPFKNKPFFVYLTSGSPGNAGKKLWGWLTSIHSLDSLIIQPFSYDTSTRLRTLLPLLNMIEQEKKIDIYINMADSAQVDKLFYAGPLIFKEEKKAEKYPLQKTHIITYFDSLFRTIPIPKTKPIKGVFIIPKGVYFMQFDTSLNFKNAATPTIITNSIKHNYGGLLIKMLTTNKNYYARSMLIGQEWVYYTPIKLMQIDSIDVDKIDFPVQNKDSLGFSKVSGSFRQPPKQSSSSILVVAISVLVITSLVVFIPKYLIKTVMYKAILQSVIYSLSLIIGSSIDIYFFICHNHYYLHPYADLIFFVAGTFLLTSTIMTLFEKNKLKGKKHERPT